MICSVNLRCSRISQHIDDLGSSIYDQRDATLCVLKLNTRLVASRICGTPFLG